MKKQLLIYGAGGLGREVMSMIHNSPEWEAAGFIDDTITPHTIVDGLPVLGGLDYLQQRKAETNVIVAIGQPSAKRQVVQQITNRHIIFPTIIHPSAIIQSTERVKFGRGTIICARCMLTTGISIGDHVLVNLNVTIGHDVSIGNFSSIMPGVNLAGECSIGAAVLIGSGANVLNRIKIADSAVVGMGAVVIKQVDQAKTVVGIPAKPIR